MVQRTPDGRVCSFSSFVSPGSPFRQIGFDFHNLPPSDFFSTLLFFAPEPGKLWSSVTSCGRGFTIRITFFFLEFSKNPFSFFQHRWDTRTQQILGSVILWQERSLQVPFTTLLNIPFAQVGLKIVRASFFRILKIWGGIHNIELTFFHSFFSLAARHRYQATQQIIIPSVWIKKAVTFYLFSFILFYVQSIYLLKKVMVFKNVYRYFKNFYGTFGLCSCKFVLLVQLPMKLS